ncbi:carbohydrate binding domain-containing protein [Croceitalea vernalis]|uniref:Carbohydrate binding domain-containing protein n=1 Tax=Croceitalea vernalis TaxID=3075599 RepID=A0ABU3BJA4_9FLAO|nr:carbohydrate binding domain-containing protein [Croceitalea sp. P007]MDT0622238.1 carbohydrate binding domain-containing protein [Croceitalea sp. P007]
MKIFKHFLVLFITTGLLVSCGGDDDDNPMDNLEAPSNVTANIDIAQDDTGTVTVTPTADGATSFEVLFGDEDNETPTNLSPGQSATNVYGEGTFTITLTAIGADGQETQITNNITVAFTAPSNLMLDVVVSESNPFEVTVTPTADDATMFAVLFGDEANGEEATTIMAGASAVNEYEAVGEYTITVTAMGASATTIEVMETVLIEEAAFDGGLIVNGDFEAGAEPWNAGVEAFDAPPAPVVTEDGNTFYSVTVDNPDPNQPFLVNLSQQGLTLVDGTNYILTFDAWSDRDRPIIAGIGESSGGFASVAVDVNLTSAMQTFTLNLTAVGFGGDDIRVIFDSNGAAGLVNIDNVTLFEGGDGSDTPGGGDATELIVNGDFEAGAEPWNAGVEEFDAPPAPVVTENGNTFYSVTIDNPDPNQPFLVNLSQQGLSVAAGANYILTFDAWSDRNRTIIAGIGESGANGAFASVVNDVNLTAAMQTFTLNLTADGFGGDDIRVLFDSNGEAGLVNIDNVSLIAGGDGSDTPGGDGGGDGGTGSVMLINGDFEDGAEPWNAGVEEFDAPPAPVVTENGNTFYSVTIDNPDASQPFLVNLSQQGLSVTADANYILTFDAWSDRNRTIIAGIGESGANGAFANVVVDVSLTDQIQTFTLNLTAAGFGGDDIRVLFDNNGMAGLVNIDNVSIVEGGDGSDTP